MYLEAFRRTLRTEWRYTFLSARKEYTNKQALKMFIQQMWLRTLDVPNYARELRGA